MHLYSASSYIALASEIVFFNYGDVCLIFEDKGRSLLEYQLLTQPFSLASFFLGMNASAYRNIITSSSIPPGRPQTALGVLTFGLTCWKWTRRTMRLREEKLNDLMDYYLRSGLIRSRRLCGWIHCWSENWGQEGQESAGARTFKIESLCQYRLLIFVGVSRGFGHLKGKSWIWSRRLSRNMRFSLSKGLSP